VKTIVAASALMSAAIAGCGPSRPAVPSRDAVQPAHRDPGAGSRIDRPARARRANPQPRGGDPVRARNDADVPHRERGRGGSRRLQPSVDQLVRLADAGLYAAKISGRNCCERLTV
jgi:hypothetical protein